MSRYRLLGSCLELRAPPAVLELCDRTFGAFRASGDTVANLRIEVEIHGPELVATRTDAGGATTVRLGTAEQAFGYVYAQVVEHAATSEPRLLCVHGAALARERRGVIVAAASRHGKTTLALALTARGFALLSDELAAIDRDSGLVHPFPMAVGCRRGTHALLRESVFQGSPFRPSRVLDKMFLSVGDDVPGAARPVALRSVVFVERGAPPRDGLARYRVAFEPADPGMAEALRAIPGVESVEGDSAGRAVEMQVRRGEWIAPPVEAVFARRGAVIVEVEDLDLPAPGFHALPAIEKLGLPEGVLTLFRHLRGFGHLEQLAREHPGGFAGLTAGWIERLAGVRFHRLTPGRLPDMLDAIETACGDGS